MQRHLLGRLVAVDMGALRVEARQPPRVEPPEAGAGGADQQAAVSRARRDVAGRPARQAAMEHGHGEQADLLAERLTRGFDWTSVTVWQEMSRWAVTGQFEYDDDWRTANVPLLVILGDFDHLVPPEDGRAAWERSGSEDKTLLLLDDFHHDVHWGHLDLVIGTLAMEHVWTPLAEWMTARSL